MAYKKPPMKLCLKCRDIKPIQEFYKNNGWAEQSYADTICCDCAKKEVVDKESARRYCWQNNRVWSDALWNAARKKADYVLANNQEYLNKNTSGKRRTDIENEVTARQFFSVMNAKSLYAYVDNGGEDGVKEFNPDSLAGTTQDDGTAKEDDELTYSEEWGGMFTRRELRYLDDYYRRMEEDFVLDNVNIEDYARRVAKAALASNIQYEKMRKGQGTVKEWQDAQDVFDKLSKSGKFAECQRTNSGNGNMAALSLIIMDIELNHHNEMPMVEFPKDDVDRILEDMNYTGIAIS